MDRLAELRALAPHQVRGQESYKAVLEAAEEQFLACGVAEASPTTIQIRSGVSSASFYQWFPDGLPDLALMAYFYRLRRVKHSIRTNLHHVLIHYHLPSLTGESVLPAPVFLTIYVIVHSIFRTLREKSELDHDLVTFLSSRNISLNTTSQEGLIIDEVVHTLLVMSPSLPPQSAKNLARIIVHGTKGVLEGCWINGTPLEETLALERALIEMYAHTYARMLGDPCQSCAAMRAVDLEALIPLPILRSAEPITSTVPTQPLTLPETQIQALVAQLRAGEEKN